MTLYDLFHSIQPEVLLLSVMEVNAHNDVVLKLEASYLPNVLNALPEEMDGDDRFIYVVRDNQFRTIVALSTALETEISLRGVLSRHVMISDQLKHLPPEKIAAYCYCSLPVCIIVEKNGHCPVSRAFDPETNSVITKVQDYIRMY